MTDLLVTGGAGFIGTNFVRQWALRHPLDRIVVLDALTYAGRRANLNGVGQVDFVEGDIRDRALVEEVLRTRRLDTIVHFAAESHVDRSIAGPDAFIGTNIVGTHSLLEASRAVWLDGGSGRPHRFLHISTDEVYGSRLPEDRPSREGDAYAPNSPYSASKAASDHLIRAYNRTYGLDTVITICPNNYGPYQNPEKLIPMLIANALRGLPLPVYGDGSNIREWLNVEDHCNGIALALLKGVAGKSYHIGGGLPLRNIDIVAAVCCGIDQAFEYNPRLVDRFPDAPPGRGHETTTLTTFVADRPGHDLRYAIDDTKARSTLGYRPEVAFAEGLAGTIAWYLANEAWWRP